MTKSPFTTITAALFLLLVCSGLVAVVPAAAGEVDLLSLVTTDADVTLRVENVPSLIERWHQAPLSQLWKDEQVQQFFAPLRQELGSERWNEKVKEETGYEMDELLGMMTGELVLYFPDLMTRMGETDPAIVLLAEVGDNQDQLRELLLREMERGKDEQGDDDGSTWVSEEHRDIELHLHRSYGADDEPEDKAAWAMADGVLVASIPGDFLRPVLSNLLDGGAESPLTSTASYQSVSRHVSGRDLVLFADVARMVPPLLQALEEDEEDEQQQEEPAAAGPSPQALFSAFGLNSWLGLFLSLDFDGGETAVDLGLTFAEPKGLMQVLAYGPEEAPRPDYIPAEAIAFNTATFDIQAAWEGVRGIFESLSPGVLEMMAAQAAAVTQQAGVELDLRRDLLESFGSELIMVQLAPPADIPGEQELPPTPEMLFGVSLNQRQGIELALETLKGMAGQGSELFEEREFLGTTIYTLKTPGDAGQEGAGFSYAVTDSQLLLSVAGTTTLEAVLIAMQKPGTSVWQRKDVKAALATLPAGAAAVGFQDMAGTGNQMFMSIALMAMMAGEDESTFCDPAAMPDDEVIGRYLGPWINGMYRDSNSLLIRSKLLPAAAVRTEEQQ